MKHSGSNIDQCRHVAAHYSHQTLCSWFYSYLHATSLALVVTMAVADNVLQQSHNHDAQPTSNALCCR